MVDELDSLTSSNSKKQDTSQTSSLDDFLDEFPPSSGTSSSSPSNSASHGNVALKPPIQDKASISSSPKPQFRPKASNSPLAEDNNNNNTRTGTGMPSTPSPISPSPQKPIAGPPKPSIPPSPKPQSQHTAPPSIQRLKPLAMEGSKPKSLAPPFKPVVSPSLTTPSFKPKPPLANTSKPLNVPAPTKSPFPSASRPISERSTIRTMKDDLGKAESSQARVPAIPIPSKEQPPTPKPGQEHEVYKVATPTSTGSSGNKSALWIIILAVLFLILTGAAIWFFFLRDSVDDGVATPTVTPTIAPSPTVTATPKPTPSISDVLDIFFPVLPLELSLSGDADQKLQDSINLQAISVNNVTAFRVVRNKNVPLDESNLYTLDEFLSRFGILPSTGFLDAIDADSLIFTLYGLPDGRTSRGFVVMIDPDLAQAGLSQWQSKMTSDFSELFEFDPTEAQTPNFRINIEQYEDIVIYFRNFPDPTRTIDFAVVGARNGQSFVVFANSKDHVFTLINKLLLIPSV